MNLKGIEIIPAAVKELIKLVVSENVFECSFFDHINIDKAD